MSWVNEWRRRLAALVVGGAREVARNVNGLLFVGGVACVWAGVRAWSPAAAVVVVGVIAMGIGAAPYVWRMTGGRKQG